MSASILTSPRQPKFHFPLILQVVVYRMPFNFLSRQTSEMKSMKGRFLKKLRFIPSKHTLKQSPVSQENSNEKAGQVGISIQFTNVEDEELELGSNVSDKEKPSLLSNDKVPAMKEIEEHPSLSYFEEKCPPGGKDSIILYTTSLRSIRKTFEDCQSIRFLLESFKVKFYERDVSMHLEFREELWRVSGGRVIPPRLFIKGRYIGGADEVITLHEQGKLKKLMEGIPRNLSNLPCSGCGNMRFIVCTNCNGSRKIVTEAEHDEMHVRCPDCNENGLVKCVLCS